MRDSNNTNTTAIDVAGQNVTDSGNNTNWTFATASVADTFTGYYDPFVVQKRESLRLTQSDAFTSPLAASAGERISLSIGIRPTGRELNWMEGNFKLQVAPACNESAYRDMSPISGDVRIAGNQPNAFLFGNHKSSVREGMKAVWTFPLIVANPKDSSYCFRAVKADGSLLDGYEKIAVLSIISADEKDIGGVPVLPIAPSSLPAITQADGANEVGEVLLLTKDLEYGMDDAQVIILQRILNSAGYPVAKTGLGSRGNESSYFGAKTRTALKAFQRARGIAQTGITGPQTRKILNTLILGVW